MRQVVYNGERSFELRDHDRPEAGPDEVIVEVSHTGLCGTDLHIFHGDMDGRVTVPAVIGHEMSGRVLEVGADVEGWSVGAPVTVMPTASCGQCPACAAGHAHICHRLNFLGIDSAGSLQECWAVPATLLVPLPDELSLSSAAIVEPTAVAAHDVRRADVRAGDRVVVVGAGPVGTLIAVVARHAGADVVIVEPDPFRRRLVQSLKFTSLDPNHEDVAEFVTDWTAGAGAAVSFEVSGAAIGVATAVDVLATRGRLCLVAIHPRPREVDLHRFFWRELTLCGARLYDRNDFARAIELIQSDVVPVATMISDVVPLDNVAAAFERMERGGEVMKVLVDCGSGS